MYEPVIRGVRFGLPPLGPFARDAQVYKFTHRGIRRDCVGRDKPRHFMKDYADTAVLDHRAAKFAGGPK